MSSPASARLTTCRSQRRATTEHFAPTEPSESPTTTCTFRSYRGRGGAWFPSRSAASRAPHPAGGVERNAASEEPDDNVHPAIDRAYRTKYGGHSDACLLPMITRDATPKHGSGRSWPDRHRRIERRAGALRRRAHVRSSRPARARAGAARARTRRRRRETRCRRGSAVCTCGRPAIAGSRKGRPGQGRRRRCRARP